MSAWKEMKTGPGKWTCKPECLKVLCMRHLVIPISLQCKGRLVTRKRTKDREDTDTQLGFNESVRVHHLHCSTISHTDTDLSCKESVPVYCKQCTLCFECLCAVLVVFV